PGALHRRALLKAAAKSLSGCLLSACSSRSKLRRTEDAWASHSSELEAQVGELMRATSVPGLSVAVFKKRMIVWQRSFRVKDRESGSPVATGRLFEAASMSKPLFASVILKLGEKSVLDLDTPLRHYTRRRFIQDDSRLDLITARHILSHSSGLAPDWRA